MGEPSLKAFASTVAVLVAADLRPAAAPLVRLQHAPAGERSPRRAFAMAGIAMLELRLVRSRNRLAHR